MPWSEKRPTDSRNPEMFTPAPVALAVQSARDAQGRGMIICRKPQKPCDVGLFGKADTQQDIFSIINK